MLFILFQIQIKFAVIYLFMHTQNELVLTIKACKELV